MLVKLDYSPNSRLCHIEVSDPDVWARMNEAFSVPNDAKKFVKGPQKRFISDRIHFITPTGSFNFGIAEIIIGWIKEYVFDRTVNYEFSDNFKKRFTPDMSEIE